jgi:hypothetical protein
VSRVQRWYPVGGLYVNGQRVVTQQAQPQGPVLTPPQQTPDDVRAEFSSLLQENADLRHQLADSERREPE